MSKSKRSAEFRFLPADSISLTLNDNAVKLIMGLEEQEGEMTELVGVHMTHRTALLLRNVLSDALDHYQASTGRDIEVPNSPKMEVKKKSEASD